MGQPTAPQGWGARRCGARCGAACGLHGWGAQPHRMPYSGHSAPPHRGAPAPLLPHSRAPAPLQPHFCPIAGLQPPSCPIAPTVGPHGYIMGGSGTGPSRAWGGSPPAPSTLKNSPKPSLAIRGLTRGPPHGICGALPLIPLHPLPPPIIRGFSGSPRGSAIRGQGKGGARQGPGERGRPAAGRGAPWGSGRGAMWGRGRGTHGCLPHGAPRTWRWRQISAGVVGGCGAGGGCGALWGGGGCGVMVVMGWWWLWGAMGQEGLWGTVGLVEHRGTLAVMGPDPLWGSVGQGHSRGAAMGQLWGREPARPSCAP